MPAVSVRTLLRDASTVFESMERDGEPVLITRRGRPVAALVPVDPEQAEAMILAAAPAVIESRRQAENARAEGRTTPLSDVLGRLDAMDAEQAASLARHHGRGGTPHEGFRDDPEIPRFGADDPPEYEPDEEEYDDEEEYELCACSAITRQG